MVKALGYSQTSFDPANPGRLCRGRESWVEGFPLDEPSFVERLVISGAAFSDDTARDAQRGLRFSGLSPGQVLGTIFPDQELVAFCEQGEVGNLPERPLLAELHLQPRYGGRRMDRCVRWRVGISDPDELDAVVGEHNGAADGFLPSLPSWEPELEEALFLLTGQGERLGYPVRRFQAAAILRLTELVPWVCVVHLDKHAPALGIYSRERLEVEGAIKQLAEQHGVLPVPFSIPPMLARWDRALYELRQTWGREREFPVPPGDIRRPAYERQAAPVVKAEE